jgi:RNA polymerase sigma-70 factor (ECF subfamily)
MQMTTQSIIEQIFREEVGRVVAVLYAHIQDLELIEDVVQDALVLALERWHVSGVPPNPAGWIVVVARRKAIDRLRRDKTLARKTAILKTLVELEHDDDTLLDAQPIPDERLKLIFTCCHPALAKEAQVALTLQTLGGLTTAEIASAFLVPLPTIAQRIVRAKRKIRDAGVPYQVPELAHLAERLDAVLSVLYLIFNAGYTAHMGNHLIRHDLCAEALRLTRILLSLLEKESHGTTNAEVMGLLALMLLHQSRAAARLNAEGELVPLEEQDRTLWNQSMIAEGSHLLEMALAQRQAGVYQIQAAIAALHAQAKTPTDTDWAQIVILYDILYRLLPSPIVELNRAVAVALAQGVAQGLMLLDSLEQQGALNDYYLFHAARADLLRRKQSWHAAHAAYSRALALCQNTTEQAFLRRRLNEIAPYLFA